MLKSQNLLLAALLAGIATVSLAQTPAAGSATESATAMSARQPVAEAAGRHKPTHVKKTSSKRKPAKKHHRVAKKHIVKHAA